MSEKPFAAIGVDVGSKLFHLAVHGKTEVLEFENTDAGRKALVHHLKKMKRKVKVVLESTGAYGLELALRLVEQKRFTVHYINPAAAKAYAGRGLLPRAKCDRVDALALARMAADDLGTPWSPPAAHLMTLRGMTRRIRTLINDATREKNRLKAGKSGGVPKEVLLDIEESIQALDLRVANMRAAALAFATRHASLEQDIALLCTIPGVAEATATECLAEIRCMPDDLTCKQLVAQAGLDPRAKQSGMRDGPRSISKMGSKYLRATLHMASLNASRWCPEVAEYFRVLTEDRNKHILVARVAIARKLLHCMHGMLQSRTPFDASKFYNPKSPAPAITKSG